MSILIIGAGGHGKVVADILRAAGTPAAGFVDADARLAGTNVAGLPVLGLPNHLTKIRQQHRLRAAIVAIGDNRVRQSYVAKLRDAGYELANALHPSAVVSASATIGKNVVIAAGAIVCADARIGDSTIINTAAVVDHECHVGEAAHVCPTAALAGRVRVGAGAFVGVGAKVLPCVSIGDHAIIGAGAVVLNDVPAEATAVGVPARIVAAHSFPSPSSGRG